MRGEDLERLFKVHWGRGDQTSSAGDDGQEERGSAHKVEDAVDLEPLQSFNHLVGTSQQRGRHVEIKLRSLEIGCQLEFDQLHNGQIGLG